ncbi:MAG: hypothetical protein LBM67_08925, partial [Lentimicrobiaceae bacterium]|nr:hypothetical protein [Lentimicrobiaceae bacterium]
GETLETEEAMWHLTALLNFDYGDAGHEFSEFVNDTSYIVISKTDDGVSYEELNNAYTDLQEFVETAYETSDLDNKHVYVVVAKAVSEDDENMTIETVSTLGSERGGSAIMRFGPTDYWWESNSGKCGPYLGQYPDRGAPTQLTSKLNLNLGVLMCENGSIYFTDFQEIWMHGSDLEHLEDPDSPCGFRIFYNETYSQTGPICLDPDALNYYLRSYADLGNLHKPTGKHTVKFTVYWDVIISYSYPSLHTIIVEYAKANCGGGGGAID